MDELQIQQIVQTQREYFLTGAVLQPQIRIDALNKLKEYITSHEQQFAQALQLDLGKSSYESYLTEIGMVLHEISYMIKHIPKFIKRQPVKASAAQFPSKCFRIPAPYGVVLIMSPWNYPFLLSIQPLVDAIAAGNTVVLKPSAFSINTTRAMQDMLRECFSASYVTMITGGHEENTALLNQNFDYIFFTGSQRVGREVMRKAAEQLTPVTLELGGKSPCIVDETADLKLAAKRIVFGKFLNCGQTCVAPDYILCHENIRLPLIEEIKKQIRKQFGSDPLQNRNYGHIINQKHYDRLLSLMDPEKTVHGGRTSPDTLQIEPTVLEKITFDDPVMQQEIFGPLLPVLSFSSLEEAVYTVNSQPHPLALYIFSTNDASMNAFLNGCGFGGGCVNDTIMHLASSELGFGGFGESGMGSYHGKTGFDTFTHMKSIVYKKSGYDLPLRYQPYRRIYNRILRRFLK